MIDGKATAIDRENLSRALGNRSMRSLGVPGGGGPRWVAEVTTPQPPSFEERLDDQRKFEENKELMWRDYNSRQRRG